MISAENALDRLRAGNRRYLADDSATDSHSKRRAELIGGQHPFAIIVGCSDSRVPVATVFDQGLGDLFVVRTAGNIVTPTQIGSVEFAAENFGSRLVVVLGHSNCGAVKATLDAIKNPPEDVSPNLLAIVESIRPAVEGADVESAVRANVRHATKQLRDESAVLKNLMDDDGLKIVGAEYSLETGVVEFFDE